MTAVGAWCGADFVSIKSDWIRVLFIYVSVYSIYPRNLNCKARSSQEALVCGVFMSKTLHLPQAATNGLTKLEENKMHV